MQDEPILWPKSLHSKVAKLFKHLELLARHEIYGNSVTLHSKRPQLTISTYTL